MKPKRGEIWLVRFPFTDLTSTKLRPALVWAEHQTDLIVIGIFSRVPAGTLPQTWVLMEERHPEFSQTGLQRTSLIKAEKIAIIHESVFQRQLGSLPSNVMTQVQESLKKALYISEEH